MELTAEPNGEKQKIKRKKGKNTDSKSFPSKMKSQESEDSET